MKLVVAYIRPECLGSVKQELYAKGLYSMSVTNILGSGRQKGYVEMYRGVATEVTLLKKVRIELCLHDEDVQKAMRATASSTSWTSWPASASVPATVCRSFPGTKGALRALPPFLLRFT